MPTRHVVCFTALGVLALMGAAATVPKSPYTSDQYGFSFQPPTFELVKKDQVAMVANFLAPPDQGFASNVNVMIQPQVTVGIDEFIKANEAQYASNGGKVRSHRKLKISDRDAVLMDTEAKLQGRDLRFLQLAVLDNNRTILITCTATAATFPRMEKQFQASLTSFTLNQ